MSESKHTPGPWEYREISPYDDGIGYISAAGRDIIHAGVSELDPDENRANGRLQAAAPDMLEALKKLTAEMIGIAGFAPEIRALVGNTNWAVLGQRVQEAHAAIARAEGRHP